MFIERLPRTYELQFLDEAPKKATVNRPIPLYSKKIFSIYITSWFNYIIEQIMTWFLQEIQYHYALSPSKYVK